MEKTKEEAKTTSKADSKEKAASASNESGFERVFKLKQNGTTIRTEIIAGLTTFMTMAYIIALNPNLLTGFGAEGQELWNGVFLATCIASAIGTICMAFLANKPFVMAPGMGLNSFFALVVSNIVTMTGMTYLRSFQSALVVSSLLRFRSLTSVKRSLKRSRWACVWVSDLRSVLCS